jgi:hypothetical protein
MTNKINVGIDWGTQSSKWFVEVLTGEWEFSPVILDSALSVENENLVFIGDKQGLEKKVIGLKRKLLSDPLGPDFWEAPRHDTKTSLGEAVAFSLASILGHLKKMKGGHLINPSKEQSVSIRFSAPNWVNPTEDQKMAIQNFGSAAAAALCIVCSGNVDTPVAGESYPINKWKQLCRETLEKIPNRGLEPYEKRGARSLLGIPNLSYWLVPESCAAGLPYVVENWAIDKKGIRKLLVVDVGAGSTDVGYLLRTTPPPPPDGPGGQMFLYLQPAPALDVAGDYLTDKILQKERAAGRNIVRDIAEAQKITTREWQTEAFVKTWVEIIVSHVTSYIRSLPDPRFLRDPQYGPLNLVLTGGSSQIRIHADSLILAGPLIQRIEAILRIEVILAPNILSFPTPEDSARMAVAVGASSKKLPNLKPKTELPPPYQPIVIAVDPGFAGWW